MNLIEKKLQPWQRRFVCFQTLRHQCLCQVSSFVMTDVV